MNAVSSGARVFKTAWFAKAARKARISDAELCDAMFEAMKGQCDDLGGGVFKKRLDKNRSRSIIVAKGGRYWVYAYLFAKKDRANISPKDLRDLRAMANYYAGVTSADMTRGLEAGEIMEICDGDHAEV
ncbi:MULTISPECIES: type II toxin-antitoxin system RelE/ParE family toxin [Brevundimonas]|uniref:Type II toxin-antitoxin system RelE/ParE family toxin n=1 Tax=Brevundimonas abyssalis TAR-001 TaxID=1391729 RepID=A0A8E0NCU9_9CAUL|nr:MULTISPECIES: type II toxin-antitoxin system RelE/ParE family toxin [Brevundimonas]GAD60045.1 hypothetical protein MBEBAB_2295 [Brevundimonas abyssalis TAR-001]